MSVHTSSIMFAAVNSKIPTVGTSFQPRALASKAVHRQTGHGKEWICLPGDWKGASSRQIFSNSIDRAVQQALCYQAARSRSPSRRKHKRTGVPSAHHKPAEKIVRWQFGWYELVRLFWKHMWKGEKTPCETNEQLSRPVFPPNFQKPAHKL